MSFSGKQQLFLAITFLIINRQCGPENLRYAFNMEWFDPEASITRPFLLFYYPSDCSVELTDVKRNRVFLRRTRAEGVTLDRLHEGASVNLYGRLMGVRGFADDFTRNKLGRCKQRTFAMVKPDAVCRLGDILDKVGEKGFNIAKMKMTRMTPGDALAFYEEHRDKPFFGELTQFVTSGPVLAMELVAEDAVQRWRDAIGPTDAAKARSDAPDSLRALYGTDTTRNALHGSDSVEAATRESNLFFPETRARRPCAQPPAASAASVCAPNCAPDCGSRCANNSTCCVVLPHLVQQGRTGEVIKAIENEGFRVASAEMFFMENANAQEFYEVYKGVVPEYSAMVNELVSGPCVALQITGCDNVAERFRQAAGPRDPEMARQLRPNTLRARFGVDRVKAGLHCSDLPEDGPLESEYFFKILQ